MSDAESYWVVSGRLYCVICKQLGRKSLNTTGGMLLCRVCKAQLKRATKRVRKHIWEKRKDKYLEELEKRIINGE